MAMLLRMGGVPARVVTGFSPGGYSERKHAWIVRDTDAHSWVEAWFDELGWVTFDPTPVGDAGPVADRGARAPGRVRRLRRAPPGGDAGGSAPRTGGVRPDLLGGADGAGGGAGGASGGGGGGVAWYWFALAGLALAGAGRLGRACGCGAGASARPRRSIARSPSSRRRCAGSAGRPEAASTTLSQLERRVDRSPDAVGYLRALRGGRYAPSASPPTSRGRRALRRELGRARGLRGKLRALFALPPWRA